MGGAHDPMDDDTILNIKYPTEDVGGPYIVVYKDKGPKARWAIVALDYYGEPRLGIRWFSGKCGYPNVKSHPVWFMMPDALTRNMLHGLPLNHELSIKLDDFLSKRIKGIDLQPKTTVS